MGCQGQAGGARTQQKTGMFLSHYAPVCSVTTLICSWDPAMVDVVIQDYDMYVPFTSCLFSFITTF
jgi:hypothetical protein